MNAAQCHDTANLQTKLADLGQEPASRLLSPIPSTAI